MRLRAACEFEDAEDEVSRSLLVYGTKKEATAAMIRFAKSCGRWPEHGMEVVRYSDFFDSFPEKGSPIAVPPPESDDESQWNGPDDCWLVHLRESTTVLGRLMKNTLIAIDRYRG